MADNGDQTRSASLESVRRYLSIERLEGSLHKNECNFSIHACGRW